MRECIKEGVLTDQLTYLGSEVMGMFATEFDMDEAVKVWKEEARELLKATEEEIQKVTKEM